MYRKKNTYYTYIMEKNSQEIHDFINKIRDLNYELGCFDACNINHFHEIKYFSKDGKSLPNGIGFQKGNFLHECKINAESFSINEDLHSNQYGLSDYRGGVIVFSTDVNAVQLSDKALINKLKQIIRTFKQRYFATTIIHNTLNKFNKYNPQSEYVGAYSIGHSFKGHYIGDNGEKYNENSLSIEINGLSSNALLYLAEYIARIFKQETVLVKDLNNNKIYLANGLRSKATPNFDTVNVKV